MGELDGCVIVLPGAVNFDGGMCLTLAVWSILQVCFILSLLELEN